MCRSLRSSPSFHVENLGILWHPREHFKPVFRQVNPSPGSEMVSGNITYTSKITWQKHKKEPELLLTTQITNFFFFFSCTTDLLSLPSCCCYLLCLLKQSVSQQQLPNKASVSAVVAHFSEVDHSLSRLFMATGKYA